MNIIVKLISRTPTATVMSPGEGEQLFHATPRIVGTPMGSGANNNGPEKPLRQYAYEPHEVPPQVSEY